MDEEETFDVSNIVVDMGWEVISDPIMLNNPNENCHAKSEGESK